jgi:hypothetical protein
MNWDFAIAVVGAAASLCSLLIAEPTLRSRLVHVTYSAVIVIVIFIMTSRSAVVSTQLEDAARRLALIESIQQQADALLRTVPSSTSSPGENRGTLLKVISFLEKHRSELPDTYALVRNLAEGVGLTASAKPYFEGGSEQRESLAQAGTAVRAILEGLAAGKK